jgi:regulator of cell morphogenesis and NO signaling
MLNGRVEEPVSQLNSPLTTLAELATKHPSASRVFQKLGFDFCCKGMRSLAAACAERGVDPNAVLDEIQHSQSLATERGHAEDTNEQLIDHIVNHYHERLREELPTLVAMATKVESVHQNRAGCPHGLSEHIQAMADELISHMGKEEQILFPLILSGRVRLHGPIQVMEAEHRDHARNLERLRELTSDFAPPTGACATWRALYLRLSDFERELMEHVHLENHVLFPRALGGQ